MASELRVNTLKDASGNNSVALSTVTSGSAKAWAQIQQTSTPQTVHGSFNVSGIVDTNTSRTEVNYTNAMSDANYSALSSGSKDWDDTPSGNQSLMVGAVYATTGDSYYQSTNDGGAAVDSPRFMVAINGDLA
jgi:hypothetical protein